MGEEVGEQINETNSVKVRIRAIIDDKCVKCVKKRRFKASIYDESLTPPELLMVREKPMCVMISEIWNDTEKFLLYYECEDVWCLLNQLREGLFSSWLANLKREREREYDQLRLDALIDHKKLKSGGRRANRRRRAKERAARD